MDVRTKSAGPRARTIATAVTALAVLLGLLATAGFAAAAAAAPQRSVTLAEPIYQGDPTDVGSALTDGGRAALGAPKPGSGGWYWPIGTEDFKGWSGWLARRGAYVHVAQDMPCSTGRAVYAIGAGTVFISRADAGGYGVGGAPGGCIIITHVTAAGTQFHALYGHVSGLKVKEGQRVAAGQLIARVNGCRHLHFSTHPGAKYRNRNPYAGHVPRSWADHGGFVDPVGSLKTNPRAAAYTPPALPVVEIATQTAPFGYGAVDGAAYWSEEGAAGSATWRLELATGERTTLPAGETTPAFDGQRYDVAVLEAPAIGFSVSDHRPVATSDAQHDTPVWGAEAELRVLLTNAAGAPLQGGILKLQRQDDGRWVNVGLDVTGADGAATFFYRCVRGRGVARRLHAAGDAARRSRVPHGEEPDRDGHTSRGPDRSQGAGPGRPGGPHHRRRRPHTAAPRRRAHCPVGLPAEGCRRCVGDQSHGRRRQPRTRGLERHEVRGPRPSGAGVLARAGGASRRRGPCRDRLRLAQLHRGVRVCRRREAARGRRTGLMDGLRCPGIAGGATVVRLSRCEAARAKAA